MSQIVLQGDVSGSAIITTPSAAGTPTLTLPTTSGTILTSANTFANSGGPAFSAYKNSGTQSISNGTLTKITYDTEDFDTNNNFASSTFTPTIPGYYQITGAANFNGSDVGHVVLTIYKNGSRFKDCTMRDASSSVTPVVTSVIYFNGTTDYVEIYGYQNSGGAMNINPANFATYFNGAMIRGA